MTNAALSAILKTVAMTSPTGQPIKGPWPVRSLTKGPCHNRRVLRLNLNVSRGVFLEGPNGKTYRGLRSDIPDFHRKLAQFPEPKPQVTDWADAVRNRKKSALNEANGHRSCTILNLGKIAIRLQRPLRFDPHKQRFINDEQATRLIEQPLRGPLAPVQALKSPVETLLCSTPTKSFLHNALPTEVAASLTRRCIRMSMAISHVLKTRWCLYSVFLLLACVAFLWGPGPLQRRNMRKARKEVDPFEAVLRNDAAFSQVRIALSTAHLGRSIMILGNVPDQKSFDRLKALCKNHFSPEFKIVFAVQLAQEIPEAVAPPPCPRQCPP